MPVLAQRRPACHIPGNGTPDYGAGKIIHDRDIRQYELNHFIADYHYYEPGDIIPDIYLTPLYIIKAWWLRNLPPPVPGSHWTWMDSTYVMVTDDMGVIIRAISGDIFYINRK